MFHFKQFGINQTNSAMKICSDSCAFGALIETEKHPKNALDIGTGTGLLSLFVAQRIKTSILAIEINEEAYKDAKQNFKNSPFSNQIEIINSDFFKHNFSNKFELIFCNPPFFNNYLMSKNSSLNQAKHQASFNFNDFIKKSANLLEKNGSFWLMIDYKSEEECLKILEENELNVCSIYYLSHNTSSKKIRTIIETKKEKPVSIKTKNISFREENSNTYHPDFKKLTSEYYQIF